MSRSPKVYCKRTVTPNISYLLCDEHKELQFQIFWQFFLLWNYRFLSQTSLTFPPTYAAPYLPQPISCSQWMPLLSSCDKRYWIHTQKREAVHTTNNECKAHHGEPGCGTLRNLSITAHWYTLCNANHLFIISNESLHAWHTQWLSAGVLTEASIPAIPDYSLMPHYISVRL